MLPCFNRDMNPSTQKHLHILGICGTAMAAIAELAQESGWRVSGSDMGVYPPMSDYLAGLHIDIAPFHAQNLHPKPDLCVIGNAMSRGNVEVEEILNQGLAYCSGPEFVGRYILPQRHAIVVSGTHGKTSTASMLAHVLACAGLSPGFLIGGIPENFGSGARLGEGEYFILEGDEYDTAFFDKRSKFLHYHARTLILNNLEYDHADIFPDLAAIQRQFAWLLRTVPSDGHIIINQNEDNFSEVLQQGCWSPRTAFARYPDEHAAWQWELLNADGSSFRIHYQQNIVMEITWSGIGAHQVSNACAVVATAAQLGLDMATIAQGLSSFTGVRRRMSLVGEVDGVRIFDDFAHHPTAIQSVVSAAKAAMPQPEGRLWVVLEPRSNTMRSQVHQQRLSGCFDDADAVLMIAPMKKGHESDEDVLDVAQLCQSMGMKASVMPSVEDIVAHLQCHVHSGDDVLILSNGAFEGIHQRLYQALLNIQKNKHE